MTSKRYRIENDNLQSREHNQVIFDTIQNLIVVGNLEIAVKLDSKLFEAHKIVKQTAFFLRRDKKSCQSRGATIDVNLETKIS